MHQANLGSCPLPSHVACPVRLLSKLASILSCRLVRARHLAARAIGLAAVTTVFPGRPLRTRHCPPDSSDSRVATQLDFHKEIKILGNHLCIDNDVCYIHVVAYLIV
jgi:hypothetical protein